jgi:hypothetical protein
MEINIFKEIGKQSESSREELLTADWKKEDRRNE